MALPGSSSSAAAALPQKTGGILKARAAAVLVQKRREAYDFSVSQEPAHALAKQRPATLPAPPVAPPAPVKQRPALLAAPPAAKQRPALQPRMKSPTRPPAWASLPVEERHFSATAAAAEKIMAAFALTVVAVVLVALSVFVMGCNLPAAVFVAAHYSLPVVGSAVPGDL
jgi:hypothetical protein